MVDDARRPDEEIQDENPVVAHRISLPAWCRISWTQVPGMLADGETDPATVRCAGGFLPWFIRGLGDARESRERSPPDERQRRPVGNVTPL